MRKNKIPYVIAVMLILVLLIGYVPYKGMEFPLLGQIKAEAGSDKDCISAWDCLLLHCCVRRKCSMEKFWPEKMRGSL